MIELDHIAVSAGRLEEGVALVEEMLGVRLSDIGVHERMGTHNRLLSLGPGVYLEVIAIDPTASNPGRSRWFDLDRFEGPPRLANWIVRTPDLAATLATAPQGAGVPIPFARGPFLWQMAVPGDGRLPFDGACPALIEWESALHPAERLPDQGCRLHRLTVEHPHAEALVQAFPALSALSVVEIRQGPEKRLVAEIDTPGGRRVLS